MNKVMLIGNVGKDPDVKYYDADQAVAQFPLATTERGYQRVRAGDRPFCCSSPDQSLPCISQRSECRGTRACQL